MVGSMRLGERRERARRFVVTGLVAGFLIGLNFAAPGSSFGQQRRQSRPRHETNASRQARIARTIQETYSYPWEILGGGGYLRWRGGEYTKRNNEVSWNVEANRYLTPKFAVIADTQGSFGFAYQELPLQFPQIARPQINEYFFTGGAGYRFYAKEKVALSVQGTGGVAWGIFSGGAKGLTGPQVGLWDDGFRPAVKAAFNVDYNFYPNLAFRFSPTWIVTDFRWAPQSTVIQDTGTGTAPTFTGALQNNLGFNAGVIYRFGHHK